MMPPPSGGFLSDFVKSFLFAVTLPISLPYFLYKLVKGDLQNYQSQEWFRDNGSGNPNYQNYQSYQSYQSNAYQDYQSNRDYGRRMEWTYVPGFGWRYSEVNYGPQSGSD